MSRELAGEQADRISAHEDQSAETCFSELMMNERFDRFHVVGGERCLVPYPYFLIKTMSLHCYEPHA